MSDRLLVRKERPEDLAEVAAVVEAAFRSPAYATFVDLIRSSDGFIADLALVASLDRVVVGHVFVSHVGLRSDDGVRKIATLSPLSVAPAHQGCGIGSALVEAVTTLADERGEPLVFLEGSPAYYGRLGFEASEPFGITTDLPPWASREAAQVKRLRNYDASLRGHVEYPSAWDAVADA